MLSAAIARLSPPAVPFPVFVTVAAPWSDVRPWAVSGAWPALDARLQLYARLSVPVIFRIDGVPASADTEVWRATLRALAEHSGARIAGYEIAVDPAAVPAQQYAFWLKLAAVQLRSVSPRALIVQTPVSTGQAAWQTALFAEDSAAYVDVVPLDLRLGGAAGEASVVEALVQAKDPTAIVLRGGIRSSDATVRPGQRGLVEVLRSLGERQRIVSFAAAAAEAGAMLDALAPLKDMLSGEVVTLDEKTVNLRLPAQNVAHRLLYNLTNFSTYFVYWPSGSTAAAASVELVDPNRHALTLRDPLRKSTAPLASEWSDATRLLTFTVPATDRPLIVDFNFGATDVFVSRSDVSAAGSLSVAEIIFRQQQTQAAQERRYRTYIAHTTMSQRFRPSAVDVFDVVTENTLFFDRGLVEWQELSFSVNGAKWGPERPDFPVLQAEKVLSLPLDLRLTADYRYRLVGTDDVDGRRCYVVAFDPVDETRTLYRGRLWIDAESFRRVRLTTVQGHMPAPVISSEETQTFGTVATVDGEPIVLPIRVSTKQLFLIAGRTLLVEKETAARDFELDPSDFAVRVKAAHDSPNIMYRDTDQGLRYLVKQDGERIVSTSGTTRAKAMAIGTTIDPSYAYPLPILGINYLNFGKDRQFALLFAGVLALGNLQMPNFGARPLDLSFDFFGIAVPSTDIVVDHDGIRRQESVNNIPTSAGVNLGYQMTPFQRLTTSYMFRNDFYFHDTQTAESFVLPANAVTNGGGLAYEYKRRGVSAAVNASAYRRSASHPWGENGIEPARLAYQKYAVTMSKDVLLSMFQTLHFGVGYYSGEALDRFSMYQFGLFDEVRMHGIPAGGIRFPELVLGRASYSFNVFDQFRIDLFLDRASGRDPLDSSRWLPLTGTGAAINFKAFGNTMLKADVGKGFLPAGYAGAGSWVIQVMLLKPL